MPDYEFRCEEGQERLTVEMAMEEVPSIGQFIPCVCEESEYRPHEMQRLVNHLNFAEVRGTPSNKIGMALEDRAELGRRRAAERSA